VENIDSGYNDRNIYKIQRYIKKLNIYIVRTNNQNEIKCSAPCVYCYKIIKHLGFNKIIYSEENGNFTECKTYLYKINHTSVGYRYMKFLKYSKPGETFVSYKQL
jgi:tRNA(Arg) A34 adenosine deaminase TadA